MSQQAGKKKETKRETGLSITTKKTQDLGMWYQEVLTVSCLFEKKKKLRWSGVLVFEWADR
jgi:hypothetical protein